MLTVHLCGGLGNLLWQVAAGETVASESGRTLCFPPETPPSAHHTVNYFDTVLRTHRHPPVPYGVPGVRMAEPSYEVQPWKQVLEHVPRGVLVSMEGYFQNYRYIPEGFGKSLELPACAPMPASAAFLHLRGGDYVNHWLHDVGLTHSGGYYTTAARLFPEGTVFHVVTNDRAWASQLPWLSELPHVWMPEGTAEEDLARMAACPRGGICPNSTFAWWAAWIGRDRWPTATYVLPRTWFNTLGFYTEGYFFPGAKVI